MAPLQGGQQNVLLLGEFQPQHLPGIAPPEIGQGWAVGCLPGKGGALQSQPHQLLVERLLLAAVKGGKEPVRGLSAVIFPDGADDAVPVQVRPALPVVGLEVRLVAILLGGVPDEVSGPPLFAVPNVHVS